MSGGIALLPGTGGWRRAAVTEGGFPGRYAMSKAPSTTSLRDAVPLPVPGTN